MKFFFKNVTSITNVQRNRTTTDNRLVLLQQHKVFKNKELLFVNNLHPIKKHNFNNFFSNDGLSVKNRLTFSGILKNISLFFLNKTYSNAEFFSKSYPNINWLIEDFLHKKLNSLFIFSSVADLIKPPFVVKSILIPKKLRKKSKKKYLIKIAYRNNDKRLRSSFKQICHYSNKFTDGRFNIRLYKSLVFSFLDWKSSYLFKLKTAVFKKFFKM